MNHPTKETMALLAYGFLTASEEAAARAHLAQCTACKADWTAARGEATAVNAAFEPAPASRPRLVAWWPAAAGFAAALLGGLLIHAMAGGHLPGALKRPVAERRASPDEARTGGLIVRAEWAGSRRREISGTEWALDEGGAVFTNSSGIDATITSGNATVLFSPMAEILVQAEKGETSVLCRNVTGKVTANGVTVELQSGDAAAVVPGEAPSLLRSSADATKRLADLRNRVAVLQRAVAALPGDLANSESPEAVGAWLAKEAAQGRRVGQDSKADEVLGRLWSRVMRESGLPPAELEAGSTRERLIAGYLEGRGCPLTLEQRRAWDQVAAAHQKSWETYLQAKQELSGLEKCLAQARVAAGLGPRYAALLDETQRKAVAELDPAFREWRRHFAGVFEVVVGTAGPEKALDQVDEMASRMGTTMSDREREIERELLDGCLALHAAADPADPASEQAALLELLIKTRDRFVNDARLSPMLATSLLVNFVEGAKK